MIENKVSTVSLREAGLAGAGQNIFWLWFSWYFFETPKSILRGWRDFLKFGLNYFSVFLLLKTFFSPWHRYSLAYPRGFDFGKYFEIFFSNLISRVLGAVLRFLLIIIGCLAELFIFFSGLIIFLGWFILPALLIWGFYHGFRILL